MKFIDQTIAFLTELYSRFMSATPKFFVKIQLLCAALLSFQGALLALIKAMEQFNVEVPTMLYSVNTAIPAIVAITTAFISQLFVKDLSKAGPMPITKPEDAPTTTV